MIKSTASASYYKKKKKQTKSYQYNQHLFQNNTNRGREEEVRLLKYKSKKVF